MSRQSKHHQPGSGQHHEPGTSDPVHDQRSSSSTSEAATESIAGQLEERNAQFTRLAADFENYRRRTAQELADGSRQGAERSAHLLLPVLDNLQRAVANAPETTDESFMNGIRMVQKEFEAALSAIGVTPIEAVGQPFDPALHQAISGEETADVNEDTVIAELQPGYRLADRVLRPALVKVGHPVSNNEEM